jgi:LysR family cys regulon transcriptional activator
MKESPDTGLVVRSGGQLFGKNTARVAFKKGAYLRQFVYEFAAMLSDRLDKKLIYKALENNSSDFQL